MSKRFYRHVSAGSERGYCATFEIDGREITIGAGHFCAERDFHTCRLTRAEARKVYEALKDYFEGEQS